MSQAMRVLSLPACPGAAGHSEEGVAPLLYQSPPQKQRHTSGDPRGLEQARELQGGNSIFCRTSKPRVYGFGGGLRRKKGPMLSGLNLHLLYGEDRWGHP